MRSKYTCSCVNLLRCVYFRHVNGPYIVCSLQIYSAVHKRKIYTRMHIYIYATLLTYGERAMSNVTLCPHEIYRYFSINISHFLSKDVFLQVFALAKQEQNSSRCSSGTNFGTIQRKRPMEKRDITSSLVDQ